VAVDEIVAEAKARSVNKALLARGGFESDKVALAMGCSWLAVQNHMTYWAAATAAMANAREKTSSLKAVMPRTVAWEAAQIARMTRPPTKAGLACCARSVRPAPASGGKLGVRAHDAGIMKRRSAIVCIGT
jgi:hypothetical protein